MENAGPAIPFGARRAASESVAGAGSREFRFGLRCSPTCSTARRSTRIATDRSSSRSSANRRGGCHSVRDTGSGIAPAALPSIVDLFTHVETSSDARQTALRIGHALVEASSSCMAVAWKHAAAAGAELRDRGRAAARRRGRNTRHPPRSTSRSRVVASSSLTTTARRPMRRQSCCGSRVPKRQRRWRRRRAAGVRRTSSVGALFRPGKAARRWFRSRAIRREAGNAAVRLVAPTDGDNRITCSEGAASALTVTP